ncbi:esterase FE4-like [Bicyclus anynana]|uniref:Carboxylic ester hydrolase n=1 Tax=Bicyclus anynana TaxID=110368 RepID=A0A6J1NJ15_BICAN|nr:esterase FE4-like [Bicyclus anynana]
MPWKILKMKYGKKLVLFSMFVMNLVDEPAPEITIEQGVLIGKISRSGTIFEYTGIPYAKTDKSTRFQTPELSPKWEGVYKATEEFHMCPQQTLFGVMGSEDCLKINVYVPADFKNTKPLAVMVYIYGGAFTFGSGGKILYGPKFLVKKNVILVTFNYRIGLLGFLCLKIKEAPGNAGIKDQIAALRWVKKNIAAFGGDPDNITVFGHSSGGTSLSFIAASQASNGLFNRAIIQSGTSVFNWSLNRKPVWVASLLAKAIGYYTKDPKQLYEIFSKMDYKDIIAIKAKKPLEMYYDTGILHLPCIETNIIDIEAAITEIPYNIFTNKTEHIDVMYGTASNEGLFLTPGLSEEMLDSRNGRYLFASDLQFPSESKAMETAKKVHKFYFGDDIISSRKILNVSKLYSHLCFEFPAIFEAEYVLNQNNSKVFSYIFNYQGWRNLAKLASGYWFEGGATHGDELFYLFDSYLYPIVISEADRKMIDQITTLWTNFAKYGDPTPDITDLSCRWKPGVKHNLQFLYIDNESKMGPMLNPEGYQFWKDIYSKYRKTDIT